MSLKLAVQKSFGQLGSFIYRNPKWIMVMCLLVAILCCFSLYKLRIDTSSESNLDKAHPDVLTYKAFHERYGFEEALVIMVKSDNIFTLSTLKKMVAMHEALAQEVYNLGSIKSLANADVIYHDEDGLVIDNLQLSFPENTEALEVYKSRVLESPLLKENFISKSGDYVALYLYQKPDSPTLFQGKSQPFTSIDQHYFVESVRKVIAKFDDDSFKVTLSGGPLIGDTLLSKIAIETPVFAVISNVVIFLLLFLLFRRISAVILPLLIINVSLASTLGLMAFFDVPLSSFSQILPAFILTVGVCDAVHFQSIFLQRFNEEGNKQKAIVSALSHSGMPILMTSLTTVMGMLSFAMADIVPISSLGLFAALGVCVVFFNTLFMLPAIITLIPMKSDHKKNTMIVKSQRLLMLAGRLGWHHPILIISVFFIFLILSILSLNQLRFQHDPVKWLPPDQELPVSIELLNNEFYGAIAIEILLDTGREEGIKTREFQQRLDDFNTKAVMFESSGVTVQSSRSVVDTLKQVNVSLHSGQPDAYSVAETDELIAQELLLFEMSGGTDLEKLITGDGSKARITMLGPWIDLIHYSNYLNSLEQWVRQYFADVAVVTFTGVIYLLAPIQKLAIETMANSYLYAGIIITLTMILLFGLRLGILSMVPNLLPIIMGMGLMYVLAMPLDLYSILIGSIAIGLVVDDTVHFLNSFQVFYKQTNDAELAVTKTLETTGNALLFTTILLFSGFITYQFSTLVSLNDFGFITASIVLLALLADILLLPAILRLVYARQSKGNCLPVNY